LSDWGSLAQHSASLSALRVALKGVRDYGADIQLFDLRELNLPMFVPGVESVPAAARQLCDAVHAAQGVLWSSPLYHGTVTRIGRDKTVGVPPVARATPLRQSTFALRASVGTLRLHRERRMERATGIELC
jgi:NADPH-dependent FMN reductase